MVCGISSMFVSSMFVSSTFYYHNGHANCDPVTDRHPFPLQKRSGYVKPRLSAV